MKIAVPYENGEICSHLAQVKEFLIFDVVDDEIISTKTVKQTYANDPGALVEFLKKENTAVLLCDALPIPMMIALRETSIQVLGGAKGAPKDRVEDFLNGMLHFDRSGNNGPSCGATCRNNNKNGTDLRRRMRRKYQCLWDLVPLIPVSSETLMTHVWERIHLISTGGDADAPPYSSSQTILPQRLIQNDRHRV